MYKHYYKLTKPRVMFLVIFTGIVYGTFCSQIITSIKNLNFTNPLFIKYLLCILSLTLACGACGSINMAMEYEIDQKMLRTRNRPIAAGLINVKSGYIFGFALGILSIVIGLVFVNLKFTTLMILSVLLYVPIYTKLKTINMNIAIIIGSLSGSLPPVIISSGIEESISSASIWLFSITFCWTILHSYALNIGLKSEYEVAGISILTDQIKLEIILILIKILTIITVILTLIFSKISRYSFITNTFTLFVGLWLIFESENLVNNRISALTFFRKSIFYLFSIYLIFSIANIFKTSII